MQYRTEERTISFVFDSSPGHTFLWFVFASIHILCMLSICSQWYVFAFPLKEKSMICRWCVRLYCADDKPDLTVEFMPPDHFSRYPSHGPWCFLFFSSSLRRCPFFSAFPLFPSFSLSCPGWRDGGWVRNNHKRIKIVQWIKSWREQQRRRSEIIISCEEESLQKERCAVFSCLCSYYHCITSAWYFVW